MNSIDERYFDALGNERIVPQSTREAFESILAAAGADPIIRPAIIVREAQGAFVTTLPAASWTQALSWTIVCEDGTVLRETVDLAEAPVIDAFERDGVTIDRRRIALPELPLGYHALAVDVGPYGTASSTLIVAPPAAHLDARDRTWGIALQLYTLRSEHNWGIGDFGDLRRFVAIAGSHGARYVGLNPLHALHRSDPAAASPYAPTSRTFLNWLYLDINALPEASDRDIAAAIAAPDIAAQRERLRTLDFVDYNGVAELKDAIVRRCFACFEATTPDDPEFAAFVSAGGEALERFAIFETLVERLGRDIARWPHVYRDPTTTDVRAFADAERPAVRFALYLQWRAAQQLAGVAREAALHGMALYRDLAVGIDASGADVWADPHAYVPLASVGAPPDPLNPAGQDWGLPPLDPRALAADGYRPLAALFRANMAEAGALRIDHVMSLARLFWIPRGGPASAGGYVRYPFADALGVLLLESERARCEVIGEDLGTVPDGFRDEMAAAAVLSYRILFFEREADGGFLPPERYPALALAASGTHDMPPFQAWWAGTDIDLRVRLGLLEPERADGEHASRALDRDRLLATLRTRGILANETDSPDAIYLGAQRFLAESPARIVMFQLDDAIGETEPVNVPGTADEYPNWRRKLHLDLDAIAADPRFHDLCTTLQSARPRGLT